MSTGAGYVSGKQDFYDETDLQQYRIFYGSPAVRISGMTSAPFADNWVGIVRGSFTGFQTTIDNSLVTPNLLPGFPTELSGDTARLGMILQVSFGLWYKKIPGVIFFDYRRIQTGFGYSAKDTLTLDEVQSESDTSVEYFGISYQQRFHL